MPQERTVVNKIILNRKQIAQIHEMMTRFIDTEHFTIVSESISGIGPTIQIQFDLFETLDTKVDITDVESW